MPNYLLRGGGPPPMKRREFITLLGGAGMAVCGAGATPPPPVHVPLAWLYLIRPEGSDGETLRGIRQALRMSGSSTAAPWSSRCAMRKASPSACEDLSRICLGWTSRKQFATSFENDPLHSCQYLPLERSLGGPAR